MGLSMHPNGSKVVRTVSPLLGGERQQPLQTCPRTERPGVTPESRLIAVQPLTLTLTPFGICGGEIRRGVDFAESRLHFAMPTTMRPP